MSDIEPGGRRPESRTTKPGTFGRLQDAAEAVGARAKAVGEGAYSVLPGTYNLGRAAARGVGLLGPEEYRRFNQEMDVTAASLEQIVKHPEPAVRAAGRAVSTLRDDPLLPFYMAGRIGAGYYTRLGPLAMMGDALRTIENGHNLVDAILYSGVHGKPPPGGLLGIPPGGGGLLGVPPTDKR